nr:uncharacterized protein LOC117689908 [Crassostrea gigas]
MLNLSHRFRMLEEIKIFGAGHMFMQIIPMKRTEHQNLLWSITNNMYKGFIIKMLVHETRNATAGIGILPGNKRRLDCICISNTKTGEVTSRSRPVEPLSLSRVTSNDGGNYIVKKSLSDGIIETGSCTQIIKARSPTR